MVPMPGLSYTHYHWQCQHKTTTMNTNQLIAICKHAFILFLAALMRCSRGCFAFICINFSLIFTFSSSRIDSNSIQISIRNLCCIWQIINEWEAKRREKKTDSNCEDFLQFHLFAYKTSQPSSTGRLIVKHLLSLTAIWNSFFLKINI